MIILHVTYTASPENIAQFVEALKENKIQELTEQENGNIQYRFSLPLDCKDQVMLTEGWENQEVLKAHFSSANIQVLKKLKETYQVVSDVKTFEV